ncbi:MAG: CvpA family protein [Clostridia bacterium]|nr:CvpA family protein [Clostridia bacterium]MBQ4575996.1 CvpA family protein [Clostridia bacterium]
MSILFDLILIVVAAICIISGVRRGFIRSVINIVTLAAAVICAYMFMPAVSAYLHEEFIEESVSAPVEEELAGMAGGDESGLAQLFADSPAALSELVGRYNTELADVVAYYEEAVAEGAQEMLENLSRYISEAAAKTVSDLTAFLLIFAAVVILLKLVGWLLDLIFKLPVLSTLNRVLGIVFGIICAYLYMSVLAVVIVKGIPALSSIFPEQFATASVENTMVLKWIYEYNIFTLLK